jgi:hypothetical protein
MITGTYNLAVDPQWRNVQLQEVFLECDTTVAPVTINLFEIAQLNRFWNVKIVVSDTNKNAGTNPITINAGGSDTLDTDTTNQVIINTNGESILLQVVSETQWLAKESTGGGSGITELKLATLPSSSTVINTLPDPQILGEVYDSGNSGGGNPFIKLANGNLAEVSYCQSLLKDGTFIYEVYDTQTLDPENGYWVAFRPSPTNTNLLVKVAELKMTTQFWNNWYNYTVKDGADNEVKFVEINTPFGDAQTIEGWITTLTYSNGVLTAVDSNPNFGGATVLSLYNSLTGLGILGGFWNYKNPEFILDDDYYGMGVGQNFGWMYFRDTTTPLDSWKIVGFNVLTGQTTYIDALAYGIANITNFDWASLGANPEQAFGYWFSHSRGLTFVMADGNITDNGTNFNGVSAFWSPNWTDNEKCIYADVRNPSDSSYCVLGNFVGFTFSPSNWYWDNNNFYIVLSNSSPNAQSMFLANINIETQQIKYYKLPNNILDFSAVFGFNTNANNDSMMFFFYFSSQIFGQYVYYIMSNNEPLILQSNNIYPTNMLGSKSYSTSTSLVYNTYSIGLQVDEWSGVQF